jgi:hypothetical protein
MALVLVRFSGVGGQSGWLLPWTFLCEALELGGSASVLACREVGNIGNDELDAKRVSDGRGVVVHGVETVGAQDKLCVQGKKMGCARRDSWDTHPWMPCRAASQAKRVGPVS